ncbi:hypothetical protein P3S67_030105 [Capsicum chacoense]
MNCVTKELLVQHVQKKCCERHDHNDAESYLPDSGDFDFRKEKKIKLVVTQSTVDESEVSPNDAAGKVLGKEHSGRVRCLGLGAVPSRSFKKAHPHFGGMSSSSSNSSCPSNCQENYTQMLNAHKQSQHNYKEMVNSHNLMMNTFKAYMIMKEGMIPEQFAGFSTSPMPSDASSGPLSDVNERSYGDSYSSHNH